MAINRDMICHNKISGAGYAPMGRASSLPNPRGRPGSSRLPPGCQHGARALIICRGVCPAVQKERMAPPSTGIMAPVM